MSNFKETVLEIDLSALAHNYRYLTAKTNTATKILAVVKAFGYGSESVAVAKELETLGVDYFAVAYVAEGVALRDAGIRTPILVLHPQPINFETLIDRCLEPSIYSMRILNEFVVVAEAKKQQDYPVHIKFNTGLNRLGFREEAVSHILSALRKTDAIKTRSLFSHLVASEDLSEKEFTLGQIESFNNIATAMEEGLGYKPFLHQSNTSGILNYPQAHFDMVRTGIGLYGFGNSKAENEQLKPVATLKSVISQIHTIQPGESVGYNRAYKATGKEKTATIPIGHADGISRAFGKGVGWVTIAGKKAPIVGNVCMDMLMVNVTDIACEEGDEVIIFGENPSAEALANAIGSIPYELLTAVSQRVKRVVCRN
ncbi:MAG TPA: alanine racemase [Flavobacteriaceae bacterium]|nr:alanine racemase [Flavobacteriaceae bacterium]HBR52953.1 alanine racemase [Flavobacteriaceae bacterium]